MHIHSICVSLVNTLLAWILSEKSPSFVKTQTQRSSLDLSCLKLVLKPELFVESLTQHGENLLSGRFGGDLLIPLFFMQLSSLHALCSSSLLTVVSL